MTEVEKGERERSLLGPLRCYNTDPIIYTLQKVWNTVLQSTQVETHLHRFTLVAALETCCAGASRRTPGRPQSVPRVT